LEDNSLNGVLIVEEDSSVGFNTDPISAGRVSGGKYDADGDGDEDICRFIAGDVSADLHLAVVPIMATELEFAANVVRAVAST